MTTTDTATRTDTRTGTGIRRSSDRARTAATERRRDPAIDVHGATRRIGATTTLQPCSLSIERGRVVGIAGGSGAGKTTLLEILAGVRAPSAGHVHRAGTVAFVPQDDIIHTEMPLRRTLAHAAALRLVDASPDRRAAAVEQVMQRLDLDARADVVVGDLSGGQRKRASLAAEMLSEPDLFFLDEPTSGLDPANAAQLMRHLRTLAQAGSTVVMTTHSPDDLRACDEVVFVARGGRVAFIGSPDDAPGFFGVDRLVDVYERLVDWPADDITNDTATNDVGAIQRRPVPGPADSPVGSSAVHQWAGLVRRNVDVIRSNRLTLAILAGSPAFIIATMTFLFPAGAFEGGTETTGLAIQTLFWMAFNSFFFGITYGLLQVVGEFEIVRRERRVGLRLGAYVASKLAVLVPMLAVVNVAQMAALEAAGRLPTMSMADRAAVFVTLQLLSTAAVVVGLHASSTVQNAAQAALALPMLCFPQVLFAGAVVPVGEMGVFGRLMSLPLAVRWAFEPLGRILDLDGRVAAQPGTAKFTDAFTGSPTIGWAVLTVLIVIGIAATARTLSRRTAPTARR